MHLRDSLIYRSESLTWHVMQLARMQAAAMAKLHSTMPIQNAAGDIMRLMHRHQQFTFDDVIFNAISLFDLSAISVKRWAATPMLLIESSV
jgi:hypothetical protein